MQKKALFSWSFSKKSIKISLLFLLIVASIGTLLRASHFMAIPLKYTHLVHAHSHVAFQGWIYTALFLLLTKLYLTESAIQQGRYPLQFKLTIGVMIGVLVSFSIQGYALFSILFSTAFQGLNYWFIFKFLKDTKPKHQIPLSYRFIKTGLWLGLLSTLMPWAIGIIAAKGGKGSELYQSFIYAFLHLQYNGWFLFITIGLLLKTMTPKLIQINDNKGIWFYRCMTIAVLPAYALSLLGMSFKNVILIPAHFGGILQILAIVFLIRSFYKHKTIGLNKGSKLAKWLIGLATLLFILKTGLQYLSAFPIFEALAFGQQYIILAYLHLSLIGVISFWLLGLLIQLKWIPMTNYTRFGIGLFVIGFLLTESVLTLGGLQLYTNLNVLFWGSLAMAIGIFLLVINKSINPLSKQQLNR